MMSLEGVSYRHAGAANESISEISLQLVPGSVTGLLGPSEAGKSTLCLVAAGLAPRVVGGSLGGTLGIDGTDVAGWPMHRMAEHVVMGLADPVAQLSLVADSVVEEVAFGGTNLGVPRDELLHRVSGALEQLGIVELAPHDPRRLSVGQQQLVALAGLLAMRPRFLVLDDPCAHLDGASTDRVELAIRSLTAEGSAVLVAAADGAFLSRVCDVIVAMASGRLLASGPPTEVLADPKVHASGVRMPTRQRLDQVLAAAGIDPVRLETMLAAPGR